MSAADTMDWWWVVGGRRLRRARLRVASWIFGDGWFGVVMRLQLIHERACAAIREDGSVVLAECPALAEALYEHIPGRWRFSVALVAPEPLSPDAQATTERPND